MASKKTTDRKLDRLSEGQDKIQHGQSEMMNNQGAVLEQLSRIENLVNHSSSKDQSGASDEKVKETIAVQATEENTKKLSPESKKETDNTNQRRNHEKLSAERPLKELWAKQGFRDEFSKEMNVKYSRKTNAKHWRYLGEEFGIDGDRIDEIARFDGTSPSESMFQAMERKKPCLKIKELCVALEKAEAFTVWRIVQDAIKGKRIKPTDLVSKMWDEDPDGFQQVILNLDKKDVWREVARRLGFTVKDRQSFQRDMDPAFNLTRDLFDVLRTQCPRLKVESFKQKLEDINQNEVVKILDDKKISGDEKLCDLYRKPGVMLEIEHILNDPEDKSLWQLAEKFETEDNIAIDVEMFLPRLTEADPTYHLMEHILARSRKEPTIQDLIIHLENINRQDVCQGIIEEYVEDVLPNNPNSTCNQKTDELCQKMENLPANQEPKKRVSEQGNRDE